MCITFKDKTFFFSENKFYLYRKCIFLTELIPSGPKSARFADHLTNSQKLEYDIISFWRLPKTRALYYPLRTLRKTRVLHSRRRSFVNYSHGRGLPKTLQKLTKRRQTFPRTCKLSCLPVRRFRIHVDVEWYIVVFGPVWTRWHFLSEINSVAQGENRLSEWCLRVVRVERFATWRPVQKHPAIATAFSIEIAMRCHAHGCIRKQLGQTTISIITVSLVGVTRKEDCWLVGLNAAKRGMGRRWGSRRRLLCLACRPGDAVLTKFCWRMYLLPIRI